ncbi:hypothetical protein [Streptomyces sp. NBC_00872]|uniref:hypothetical protein n=1 Tax=Streptomyces sp. NBC_00872 TaxID=2903686 RepID=UPI00386F9A1A|nr:DUF4111 domain-containing protein [Streptomyces sp. NBC_00872]
MPIPTEAQQVTDTFLAAIDHFAPGLVRGLYLHGSLGFGEFYADRSDVDFVALLAARPDSDALEALAASHRQVSRRHGRPHFDGFHVLAEDLVRSPMDCPDVPCAQAGVCQDAGRFDVNPVTWHELARHGVTLRGPALTEADVWTNDSALRAYTHDNLTTYWTGVADTLTEHPEEASSSEATEWCVLGVSRLHHLLATGTLASKSGGGRHALNVFEPAWHPIITEALRARETPGTASAYDADPTRRGRDTADFTAMAVKAGLALGA